jgi:hypothetical protein
MTAKWVGYFFKCDPVLRDAMRRYKSVVGTSESQQIHQALREWLSERTEAWPLPRDLRVARREKKQSSSMKRRPQ